jgi:hypothetical protein
LKAQGLEAQISIHKQPRAAYVQSAQRHMANRYSPYVLMQRHPQEMLRIQR